MDVPVLEGRSFPVNLLEKLLAGLAVWCALSAVTGLAVGRAMRWCSRDMPPAESSAEALDRRHTDPVA